MLIAGGATRLSLGVQSFDNQLLPKLRGHGQATVLSALERLMARDIQINVDLIQDLPGQTRASIDEDLARIRRFRPAQVTWYLLRFHAESTMGRRPQVGDGQGMPDTVESALRRARITLGLETLGYRRQPGGRFTLDGAPDGYKAVRGGVDPHLLGMGASAYSHGWGWFFRNETAVNSRVGIRDYVERIRSGRTPVGWATPISDSERRAGRLCELSRVRIPDELLRRDDEVTRSARHVVERLAVAGLFEKDSVGWVPTAPGRLFEEEIASLFYSRAMRARLLRAGTYWAEDGAFGLELPAEPTLAQPRRAPAA